MGTPCSALPHLLSTPFPPFSESKRRRGVFLEGAPPWVSWVTCCRCNDGYRAHDAASTPDDAHDGCCAHHAASSPYVVAVKLNAMLIAHSLQVEMPEFLPDPEEEKEKAEQNAVWLVTGGGETRSLGARGSGFRV